MSGPQTKNAAVDVKMRLVMGHVQFEIVKKTVLLNLCTEVAQLLATVVMHTWTFSRVFDSNMELKNNEQNPLQDPQICALVE